MEPRGSTYNLRPVRELRSHQVLWKPSCSRRGSSLWAPLCPAAAPSQTGPGGVADSQAQVEWKRSQHSAPPSPAPKASLWFHHLQTRKACAGGYVPAPSCGGVHANACTSPATLLHKRIISGTHTKTPGSGKAQVISSSVGMAHNKSRETE